jgi:hypothetical protein
MYREGAGGILRLWDVCTREFFSSVQAQRSSSHSFKIAALGVDQFVAVECRNVCDSLTEVVVASRSCTKCTLVGALNSLSLAVLASLPQDSRI